LQHHLPHSSLGFALSLALQQITLKTLIQVLGGLGGVEWELGLVFPPGRVYEVTAAARERTGSAVAPAQLSTAPKLQQVKGPAERKAGGKGSAVSNAEKHAQLDRHLDRLFTQKIQVSGACMRGISADADRLQSSITTDPSTLNALLIILSYIFSRPVTGI